MMRKAWAPYGVMAAALAVTLGAACHGGDDASGSSSSSGGGSPCGPSAAERAQNQKIFDGLKPTCEGCHSTGARGYFASIETFEALVAYEPKIVTPGDPDGSQLVKLLEGRAAGNYPQMPIAGPTYAQLAQDGKASLSMQDIRDWVKNLKAHAKDTSPSLDARRSTRISAADAVRTLYIQLGLDDSDFYHPADEYSIEHKTIDDDSLYPVSSLDAIPAPYEGVEADRFATLGGGSALYQKKTDGTVTPSFTGSIAQIAQRWCALALDKAGNTTLLPKGASIADGSSDPAKVKAVLGYWFLHFHAHKAPQSDVDHVFDAVFVPLEKGKDTRTAYVGACSYYIRHPDWIFY